MIDDGWADSALSARRKAAIALTDAVLDRRAIGAADDGSAFAPAERVELGVTAVLCHGFSKIAIALGTAPAAMPVTIVPSPVPPEPA
jgi:hypothetical protein